MKHSLIFTLQDTPNLRVNKDKLYIEIAVSAVANAVEVEAIGNDIKIISEVQLPQTDIDMIVAILGAHDGEPAKSFDNDLVHQRELVVLQLNQMAIYHPLIDNDEVNEYLSFIDNYLNGWIRSANPNALIKRIYAHAGVSDIAGTVALQEDGITPVDTSQLEFYGFLQTVSNPNTGSKVFQFFASTILEASA